MKLVIVAGTPGSGKTSILIHTIKELLSRGSSVSVVKIDCLTTSDDDRYKRLKIPVRVGISADMCPDHYAIYNTQDMVNWAFEKNSDILVIETAGLCLRCAPYVNFGLAVCVVDTTSGPNTPVKIGPLLTTADVVISTKGDLVSQAEREVFRQRIFDINKDCSMIEANGLSGVGAAEMADIISIMKDTELDEMELRHEPPLAICTLCTGERRVAKKHHFGVLRSLKGKEEYAGE